MSEKLEDLIKENEVLKARILMFENKLSEKENIEKSLHTMRFKNEDLEKTVSILKDELTVYSEYKYKYEELARKTN